MPASDPTIHGNAQPTAKHAGARRPWVRWARMAGGWVLIVLGVIGIVVPVLPGFPLLLPGLALLAPEYAWAREAMETIKGWIARWRNRKKRG